MNLSSTSFTTEDIQLFVNALQLCIKSTVKSFTFAPYNDISDNVILSFVDIERDDPKLEILKSILPGKWNKLICTIHWPENILLPELTQFLMLTRLEQKNMLKLAEMDPRFAKYTHKLNLQNTQTVTISHPVHTIEQASQTISNTLKEQNGTLRSLAEQCDLTQAALSRFKSGGDIRLSNFLKLAEALNLEVTLTPKGQPK